MTYQIDFLTPLLEELSRQLIEALPKLVMAVIVIVIFLTFTKLVSKPVKKIIDFADFDGIIAKTTGYSFPVSINGLILFLFYLGVFLAGSAVVLNITFGHEALQILTEVLSWAAKLISVILVTIVILSLTGMVVDKVRMESTLKGYTLFLILLLVTALLIDVTALSSDTKQALITGLSLGVGGSIIAFAFWFFFHEYLDKIVKSRHSSEGKDGQE